MTDMTRMICWLGLIEAGNPWLRILDTLPISAQVIRAYSLRFRESAHKDESLLPRSNENKARVKREWGKIL